MNLIPPLCYLAAGAAIGLRWNVKMIGYCTSILTAAWALAAIIGHVSINDALIDAISAILCLQFGYCLSLSFATMGFGGSGNKRSKQRNS